MTSHVFSTVHQRSQSFTTAVISLVVLFHALHLLHTIAAVIF